MTVIAFDAATWLAARAHVAADLPDRAPEFVALPGSLQAIAHDRLLAHHDNGQTEHGIVEQINATWQAAHADVLAEHSHWVQGPYHQAIVELRERAAQATARELRRQAALERLATDAD